MENLKNVAPVEDFNWDAYENGETVTNASHEDLEKAYDNTLNKVNDREVVDGTVIAMNKREVVVNIGYKSDGIIPLNEFRYNPDLKVGDTVEVYIENQEDKKGQLVLSHRKARATRSWDRVNAALENEEIIKGYIKCRTKGGMIVDVFGIEAFLPGSQIDVKPIRDYDVFVGKTMEFKVVKINQEFKNVVVSHKALIEAELEQQKKEIIGKLEKGQVLEGTVKNITSYGVFIDLGGVDGLIHITDLSWGRVSDPKEVVELDQKLNVVILDFDDTKKRIANWVAYPIHSCYRVGKYERSNAWKYDPEVPEEFQVDLSRGSYNGRPIRGHQCMSYHRYVSYSSLLNEQTFYSTNIMPQDPDFNSGSWGDLEDLTLKYISYPDTLYNVTGTYGVQGYTTDKEGNRVAIPQYCWKVLLRTKSGRTGKRIDQITDASQLAAIGYWAENSSTTTGNIKQYITSVADIEEKTGYKFFTMLDEAIAADVKAQNNPSDWGIN